MLVITTYEEVPNTGHVIFFLGREYQWLKPGSCASLSYKFNIIVKNIFDIKYISNWHI